MTDFDMPAHGTWEERGGWVVRRLSDDAALSFDQAAGLVGNLGYESAGFTKLQEIKPLVPGSRGGAGWGQWTASRRREFEKWAAERGLATASDEANYGFLLYELLGAYRVFAAHLRRTLHIEDACHLAHDQYERPSDALDGSYRSGPDRLRWARRALAGAMALPADPPAAPVAPPALDLTNPIALIRQAQRLLGTEPDADPGPETRRLAREYRATHPGA